MKFTFTTVMLLFSILFCRAQITQISGRITDAATGEPLPSVTVSAIGTRFSAASNADGYFVLTGNFETLILRFTCIGYPDFDRIIGLAENRHNLDIRLKANNNVLKEIEISAGSAATFKLNQQAGMIRMNPKLIASLPSLGEKDIFRAFQLMPGVSAGNEQSAGLYVRGGTPDQNLVLFDGFTVYNVDHLFGFFSAFNANAIKDVQLFKGGFDAKYGGRLSALMDITGKEGNKNTFNAGLDMGLLSLNGFIETPVGKKMSAIFTYRRSFETSFYDKLKNQATIDDKPQRTVGGIGERFRGTSEVKSFFDDLNFRLTYRLDSGDVFTWSIYNGHDYMDNNIQAAGGGRLGRLSSFFTSNTDEAAWGNTGTSLKWGKQWNPRVYSNTLLSYSSYYSERTNTFSSGITDSLGVQRNFRSGTIENNKLYDYAIRTDWKWTVSQAQLLGFGIQYNYQDVSYNYSRNDTTKLIDRKSAGSTVALYLEDEIKLLDHKLHMVPGVRTTWFSPTGKWYTEPRLRAHYQLTELLKLKGTAGRYYQFAKRVIREDILRGSRDFWLLTDNNLVPVSSSIQYSAGMSWENNSFLLDAEAYVKKMDGLSEYTMRFQPSAGMTEVTDLFYEGTGLAKGIDLLLQKKTGRYNGWISYTLAEVTNSFDIYGSGPFYASNDIRNEFKILQTYRFGRFDLSLSWMYLTGKPYTAPTGGYQVTLLDGSKQTYLNVSEKNAFRLPDYHRLDAAATYNFGRPGKFNGALGISFFNLYNQTNIWYKNYDIVEDQIVETDVNYLGFTPNLSLSIKLK